MSSVATKTGDGGKTDTPMGRQSKGSEFPEMVGTLDELTAAIAVAGVDLWDLPIKEMFQTAQHNLLSIGASLWDGKKRVKNADIELLDKFIADHETNPGGFIIPEGRESAPIHMARAICRRAERRIWNLQELDTWSITYAQYLNRLSDALYVAALKVGPSMPMMWSDV